MRRKNDAYYTPLALFKYILEQYSHMDKFDDPCCGPNPIAQLGYEVETNDIDPIVEADTHIDATSDFYWEILDKESMVITNPPFNVAFTIVKQAVERGHKCAFLLRLSFLEPTRERGDWLRKNPPKAIYIMPRVSFTDDGRTDSSTCAWFVWNDMAIDNQQITIVTREMLT